MNFNECKTGALCVTCPVKSLRGLKLKEHFKATELLAKVMESPLDSNSTITDVVNVVKDEADRLEAEEVSGVVIGMVGYKLSGACERLLTLAGYTEGEN